MTSKLADRCPACGCESPPTDDDTPIDREFVRQFREVIREGSQWVIVNLGTCRGEEFHAQLIWEKNWQGLDRCVIRLYRHRLGDGSVVIPVETRGQLRRLCDALGVALREGK